MKIGSTMTCQITHHLATQLTCPITHPIIMTVIHDDKTFAISDEMIVQTLTKLTTPIALTQPKQHMA